MLTDEWGCHKVSQTDNPYDSAVYYSIYPTGLFYVSMRQELVTSKDAVTKRAEDRDGKRDVV